MSTMKWSNPAGRLAASRYATSALGMIDNHGERIWNAMCFRMEGFTTRTIADHIATERHLSHITATIAVRAFLAYCRAASEDFSGPGSRLTRTGAGRNTAWCLTDNEEQ